MLLNITTCFCFTLSIPHQEHSYWWPREKGRNIHQAVFIFNIMFGLREKCSSMYSILITLMIDKKGSPEFSYTYSIDTIDNYFDLFASIISENVTIRLSGYRITCNFIYLSQDSQKIFSFWYNVNDLLILTFSINHYILAI